MNISEYQLLSIWRFPQRNFTRGMVRVVCHVAYKDFSQLITLLLLPCYRWENQGQGKITCSTLYNLQLNRDSNQGHLTPGTEFLPLCGADFHCQEPRDQSTAVLKVSSELCLAVLTQSGALTRRSVCSAEGPCWQWTHPLGLASPRSQAGCTHPGALPPRAA